MKEKKYYTAGELARLFNIPKQTMLYYDKMGILKPEFVAENGYRYYSTPQYLTLEIILFLRKMDISVPDIHKFWRTGPETTFSGFWTAEKKNVSNRLTRPGA